MNLDKRAALQKLTALEKETKELRAIIEAPVKSKTIYERVFDVPSAISELGDSDPLVIEYWLLKRVGASLKTLAGHEISMFCKAMNKGIVMSWKNSNQQKHYIWFDFKEDLESSGSVYCVGYSCVISDSVSSRHTYSSEQKARHGSKCIKKVYYDYLTD